MVRKRGGSSLSTWSFVVAIVVLAVLGALTYALIATAVERMRRGATAPAASVVAVGLNDRANDGIVASADARAGIREVLSPSTAVLDRAKKMQVYAEAGVPHAWLVDPLARTLEVLRRNAFGLWAIVDAYGGPVTVRAEPFEAVELDLSLVWPSSAPEPCTRTSAFSPPRN